jgi:hypothetical protein
MQPPDHRVTCIANCIAMALVTEAVSLASVAVALTAESLDIRSKAAHLAINLRMQSAAYQGHAAYHIATGH